MRVLLPQPSPRPILASDPIPSLGALWVRERAVAQLNRPARGSALLAVLWLSAALSAIAFSVATSVRGETERASTASDGLRAYYLATASVDRALLWIFWGSELGGTRYYQPPMPWLHFNYPTGAADVEIIPETAKMNINTAAPADLVRVLIAAGAIPEQAQRVTQGIIAWRSQGPEAAAMPGLGAGNSGSGPTFAAPHASFQEIEELLLVPGMTPELFYGSFSRDPQGQLVPRGGLRDCFSVYGTNDRFDVNTAHPALLLALGINPGAVAAIVAMRRATPFRSVGQLAAMGLSGPGFQRLGVGGNTVWTLRATAYARMANGRRSDLTRAVSATIKFLPPDYTPAYQYLRWYDDSSSIQYAVNPQNPEAQPVP
ncbi:MAG: type II secretion system protein GspK [Bryobacteraceae bacterium]